MSLFDSFTGSITWAQTPSDIQKRAVYLYETMNVAKMILESFHPAEKISPELHYEVAKFLLDIDLEDLED